MWVGGPPPPPQVGRGRRALVSLEAAPCPRESSTPEFTLKELTWGHENILKSQGLIAPLQIEAGEKRNFLAE